MQKTVFMLPVETHRALRRAAFDREISMGEALRQAIEFWLAENKVRKGVKK